MFAFASNSVLCRLALARGVIDPVSFSSVRILSGAAALWLVSAVLRRKSRPQGSWISALMLAVYAFGFSFAYVTLSAGTGALIVMSSVQTTMIVAGLLGGERLARTQWMGLVLALGGIGYLLSPGLAAPPLLGAASMALAGIAWGIYSLRGRSSADPVTTTTDNFLRAAPIALVLSLAQAGDIHLTIRGFSLAIVSGALTSGLGYVLWYAALRRLTVARAAVAQLTVPVIVAVSGVVLLAESINLRLVIASVMVLGGVGMVAGSDRSRELPKKIP